MATGPLSCVCVLSSQGHRPLHSGPMLIQCDLITQVPLQRPCLQPRSQSHLQGWGLKVQRVFLEGTLPPIARAHQPRGGQDAGGRGHRLPNPASCPLSGSEGLWGRSRSNVRPRPRSDPVPKWEDVPTEQSWAGPASCVVALVRTGYITGRPWHPGILSPTQALPRTEASPRSARRPPHCSVSRQLGLPGQPAPHSPAAAVLPGARGKLEPAPSEPQDRNPGSYTRQIPGAFLIS